MLKNSGEGLNVKNESKWQQRGGKLKKYSKAYLTISSLVLALLSSTLVHAQFSDQDRAQAAYFQSEAALADSETEKAESLLNEAREILGSDNAKLVALEARILFAQERYIETRAALARFFDYSPGPNLRREMSEIMVRIDALAEVEREQQVTAMRDQATQRLAKKISSIKEQRQVADLNANDERNVNDFQSSDRLHGSSPVRCSAAADLLIESIQASAPIAEVAIYREVVTSAQCLNTPASEAIISNMPSYLEPQEVTDREVFSELEKAPLTTAPIAQGPFTEDECRKAVSDLAISDGKDRRAGSMVLSKSCVEFRQANFVDINREISNMKQMLKDEGVDYESKMTEVRLKCANEAKTIHLSNPTGGMASDSAKDAITTCVANGEMTLYTAAITEMNQNRVASAKEAYRAEVEIYEQKKADRLKKIEEDAERHQMEMDAWRKKAALCKAGNLEYCAKK